MLFNIIIHPPLFSDAEKVVALRPEDYASFAPGSKPGSAFENALSEPPCEPDNYLVRS